MFCSPRAVLVPHAAPTLPLKDRRHLPNTHEFLILLDYIYAKNGNGTRGGHQKHDTVCVTNTRGG